MLLQFVMKKKVKYIFLFLIVIFVAIIANRGMRIVKGPTYINSKIWDYDFVIVDNKIILTEYTGSNENVVIPDKILFMPVVEVGNIVAQLSRQKSKIFIMN